MSSGGDSSRSSDGEGEQGSGKKRGRGPTQLTRVINTQGKKVTFDRFGRPVIDQNTKSFSSQLGLSVKRNVPITINDWSEVDDLMKDKIWATLSVSSIYDLFISPVFI
jgi:hypothetical protein